MALDAAHLRRARPVPAVRLRGAQPPLPGACAQVGNRDTLAAFGQRGDAGGQGGPARAAAAPARARAGGGGRRRRGTVPLDPRAAGPGAGPPVRRGGGRGRGQRDGGAVCRGPRRRRGDHRLDPVLRPDLLALAGQPRPQRPGHLRDRLHLAEPGRHQDRSEHRDEAAHAHARLRDLAGAVGMPAHRRAQPAVTPGHGEDRRAIRGHLARAPAGGRSDAARLGALQRHRGRMATGQAAPGGTGRTPCPVPTTSPDRVSRRRRRG